jgi:FecR protein
MLVMRTRYNSSDPRQTASPILWLAAAIFCLSMSHATAAAQSLSGQASVTRTAPGAILYSGGLTSSVLRNGATLQPGDVIVTGVSGHVVIALGDGSQVVIFPRSRVELKNFRAGVPWRDLLSVTVGRVRATISHQLKRPNPYRVFSPVASIAVRGTDFLVTVEPSGETRVLVYEGLVEVGSLVNPQKTVLVRPGRNIIVRPDGDISLVTAAPRGELNEIRSLRPSADPEISLRIAFNSHGNSYTSLRSSRFTAFSDSHLDGLQNPAYATEFRRPSGRFYLTPSFSPKDGTIPSSYTLSPQVSYFMPLGSKIVVGAGAAVTKTDIGEAATEPYFNPLNRTTGYSHFEGNLKFTTANLSLIAARRFGRAGRTSLGLKFDYLTDRSWYSFNSDISVPRNPEPALEEGEARGRRAGLSVGVTQDIGDDKKLGVYYRYSIGSVENNYSSSGFGQFLNRDSGYFPNGPDFRSGVDFRTQPGHSSEAGLLFRGSVTRRLFYGVESSILFEQDQVESHSLSSNISGATTYISTQTYLNKRRVRRGMIGAGIGYALRKGAVLSLDLSTGRGREESLGQTHYASLPPVPRAYSFDDYVKDRPSFKAWHIGGQTDIWRNFFAGGALSYIWEWHRPGRELYLPIQLRAPLFTYSYEYSYREKRKLINLSAGWRLTPRWITQYAYSANNSYSYGPNTPSHTLMLRYEFGRREEE